jgi:2',3'-cyclic-nucleotide 2'-phosphodiesterase/3'-nucleotidase
VNPDAWRISGLRLNGHRIGATDRFVLATNSYRAAGSGGFPGCGPDRIVLDDKTSTRSALIAHLGDGAATPPIAFAWSFRPVGTSVTFDTGAPAVAHQGGIAHLRPEAMPGAAPGYRRFRLHL